MTNETNRAPSSAPTAGSIADDAEFENLAGDLWNAGSYNESIEEPLNALIAHIDTWAGRSAGERERELCAKMGAMQAQLDQLTAERSAGDAVPVAWAVTAERGGIHKLSITRESAERKAAKWREEWPDNGCQVRPLVFGGAAPAPGNTADN